MKESIEQGPQDEDAVEDAVNKITMYRRLFGLASGSEQHKASFREFSHLDQMIRDSMDKRQVAQLA